MSRRRIHVVMGVAAGAGTATLVATRNNEERLAVVLQAIGGAAGGYHGGILPDVLEPAISARHRGVAHSASALAAGGTAIVKKGRSALDAARARVRQLEDALAMEQDPWRRLSLVVAIIIGHLGLGYAVGIVAGYGSHLALDACTPGSLPLLGS